MLQEAVRYRYAKFLSRGGLTICKGVERSVVPAMTWFQLLGRHEYFPKTSHRCRHLVGGHETGIKSDEVEPVQIRAS